MSIRTQQDAVTLMRSAAMFGMLILGMLIALPARAVPMFARETGQPCTACHVGGFGPQLTPFGRLFKLEGFRLDVHHGWNTHVSGMVVESFTHTQEPQAAPPAPNYALNNNTELQQASVFFGGKLSDHMGMLGQFTYEQASGQWGWDNIDVRYVHNYAFGNHGGIFGISVNNNPSVEDVFNTAPAWMYPYFASDLAPGAPATPVAMGALGQQVVGADAYTFLDQSIYIEAGLYRTLSASLLQRRPFNAGFDGRLVGAAPYGRIAYTRTLGAGDFEVGAGYLDVRQGQVGTAPDGVTSISVPGPANEYEDYGFDANYQYLGDGTNIFTVQALYVTEQQTLTGTFTGGGSSYLRNNLDASALNGSYWYENTYGLTLSAFRNGGSADPILYGNRTGSPLTEGYMFEVNFNPFGKATSYDRPWVNFRLGLQYTFYTMFDGAATNYDGAGTNAHANNTLYAYVWTAF